jgi:hypothetical protein
VKSRAVDPEEDLRNGIGRGSSARGSSEGVRSEAAPQLRSERIERGNGR